MCSSEPSRCVRLRGGLWARATNSFISRCATWFQRELRSQGQWSNVKVPHLALQGVSTEFVLIGCVLRKRSVFILYFTHPHLFNENKLRTHKLQSKVRYFHVTPLALGKKFPMKPGRAATDETVRRTAHKARLVIYNIPTPVCCKSLQINNWRIVAKC